MESSEYSERIDIEEGLRDLFLSLVAYLQTQLRGRVSVDEILQLARKVLAGLQGSTTAPAWATAAPVSIRHVKRQAWVGKQVRLVGRLSEVSAAEVLVVPDGHGGWDQVESIHAVLAGHDGDIIQLLDATGTVLVDKVDERRLRGGATEILGVVVLVPMVPRPPDGATFRYAFMIHPIDVRGSSSILDLLGATEDERSATQQRASEFVRSGEFPLDYLRGLVTSHLGIVGQDDFTLLHDLLDFVVLQALSHGRVNHAPGRLHGLIVGPPASGKKLLGVAARVLNPVCVEISPSKASAAGLVGASYHTAEGWRSTAGLLPTGSHGVAILQDAHAWNDTALRRLGPVLQEVMEDGQVRDSVAGGQMREAETSLLIDLNRASQLGANQLQPPREAALLLLRPVLSRIDLIAEIPADPERAWRVGAAMYDRLDGKAGALEEQPWVREARLLVAHLRDSNPTVDLAPVLPTMESAHRALHARNRDLFALLPEAGDVPTRLAISFARLVAASARGHMRRVAADEDVQAALHFVGMKLQFLRLNPLPVVRLSGSERPNAEDFVRERAGQVVRPVDLAHEYESRTGESASERTMRRAVRALGGQRRGRGAYLLPERGGDSR